MYQPPRGTQDFLPEEMILRNKIFDTIRQVFEKWGYSPLETPAFEDWKLLVAKFGGGEAVKEEIYYFKDKSKRELGLRFDLTVPMARVVASNPQLPKPFKRYQIGRVWRYDKPGSGRRREFWQTDVDIVGSSFPEADAEVIAVACECLEDLGVKDFTVRLNNRKILESFLVKIGIKHDNLVDVFRSIDKLEKTGKTGVMNELMEKGMDRKDIKKIFDFLESEISEAEKFVGDKKGLEELKTIKNILSYINYDTRVKIDLSLVRGLEYYTGPVFEIVTKGTKWSIAGGGRYDNLIEQFGGDKTPATGISLGIERIFNLRKEKEKTVSLVYVANVNEESKKDVVKLSRKLRKSGIKNEYDLMRRNLRKQLEYVNKKDIPFMIVIGPKEIKSKKSKIRDMKTGKEKIIDLGKIEDIMKLILNSSKNIQKRRN